MVEDIDPLSAAYLPPANETSAERAQREASELAAKKISDEIDQMLKEEGKQRKIKSKKEIKVLLLGQSESGKSTCLKQFQLIYAPNSFSAERQAWRAVIYLNLVKSVRRIIDALSHTQEDDSMSDDSFGSSPRPETPMSLNAIASPSSEYDGRQSSDDSYSQFAAIKLRLSPLTLAEDLLVRQLAGDGEDEATQLGNYHINNGNSNGKVGNKVKEVFVRSGANWKKAFSSSSKNKDSESTASSSDSGHHSLKDDPFKLVAACADDMAALWADRNVRQVLERKKVRLQESSGFYLDDIQRITARDYLPSNQDVLNARLKTIGVIEHYFALDRGGEKGVDWKIYDVGGHRSQRQTWAPFFDDVQAIIFLAPISAFDQVLAEDSKVNRIEDSLLLFRAICANKLLGKVNIILFLNKIDILQSKLDAGIRLNRYVRSYGDRPNDYENVTRYFRSKFGAVHRENSPIATRDLFVHLTTVTDVRTTSAIIADIRETILRRHLQNSSLL